jgi:fructokinase
MLQDELRRFGMTLDGVQIDPSHATGEVQVNESAPGVHTFAILPDVAWDHVSATAARDALEACPGTPGLLYYGSLAQRGAESRAAVRTLAEALPGLGWCDLNWRAGHVDPALALQILRGARAVKVNEAELHRVLGWLGLTDASLQRRPQPGWHSAAVATLCSEGTVAQVVVTYGADGYAVFDRSGHCLVAGAACPVAQMVDTVGSGDAFTAVVIAGELCGWTLADTLERANAFAAALCGVRGAAPEQLAFYDSWKSAWAL